MTRNQVAPAAADHGAGLVDPSPHLRAHPAVGIPPVPNLVRPVDGHSNLTRLLAGPQSVKHLHQRPVLAPHPAPPEGPAGPPRSRSRAFARPSVASAALTALQHVKRQATLYDTPWTQGAGRCPRLWSGQSGATSGPVSRCRTSLILTEAQFQRIRDIADENDASIGWVLRQAIDRYLEGVDRRIGDARAVRQPRTERPHLDVIRPVVVAGDNNRRTRHGVEERGRRPSQP